MADRKVAVLDPHTSQPLKGIVVEARDASDGSFIKTARTNDEGIASFSLAVAATFHARTANTPPLYQIVLPADQGAGPFWFDYLVDPAWAAIVASGEGTEGQSFTAFHGFTFEVYSTLAGAVDAAILAAAATDQKTILVVSNISEVPIDIGGLGTSASIIITSADRYGVRITAATNSDIFTQDSGGGNIGGRLVFRNISLRPQSGKAVLDVNTSDALVVLAFENCDFPLGGAYLVRQDGSAGDNHSLSSLRLESRYCTGSLAGFYQIVVASLTFSPEYLDARDNVITLTDLWDGGSTNAAPENTRVQGGIYTVTNGIALPGSGLAEFHWSDVIFEFGGDEALFTSAANSSGGNDWSWKNIVVRTTDVAGDFLNLGCVTPDPLNAHDNIFIHGIFGYSTQSPSGTFITVDIDCTNVYVGDIHAPEWATLYSGPAGSHHAADHDHTSTDGSGILTGDEHDSFSEWAEVATPSNPAQDKFRLFARASGDSIQVVVRSSVGQEAILATLLDGAAPAAKKMLLLGVKQ